MSGFFADYALERFTTANSAQLIAAPRQMVIVSENSQGIDGVVRVRRDSPAPAIAFCLAQGFAPIGETRFVIPGQGCPNAVFRCRLR